MSYSNKRMYDLVAKSAGVICDGIRNGLNPDTWDEVGFKAREFGVRNFYHDVGWGAYFFGLALMKSSNGMRNLQSKLRRDKYQE
jgi:hypothetical protein